VRENRTQGSVRGRSGNWLVYLDGRTTKAMDIAIIPNGLLHRFEADPERRIHMNVLLSLLLLLIVATMILCLSADLSIIPHVCLFHQFFGIPCPGCGITRSLLSLLVGDIHRAWILNPAGPFLGMSLVAQVPLRIKALRVERWSRRAFRQSRAMTIGVLIILIVNWSYQII